MGMSVKWKSSKKWIIAAVLVVTVGVAGVALFWKTPSFLRVREIAVMSPMKHLSEQDLVKLSQVRKGERLMTLPLPKIRDRILRFPWVKEVRISRHVPGRLLFWVTEQTPVALVEIESRDSEKSNLYLVNAEGKIFKPLESGDPTDLPMLTGLSEAEATSSVASLVKLLLFFDKQESLGSIQSLGISEIHWNEGGHISLFTKSPCVQVEMGEDGWEEKLKRWALAWNTIRSTSKGIQVLDLNFEHRIVVKQNSLTSNTQKGGGSNG